MQVLQETNNHRVAEVDLPRPGQNSTTIPMIVNLQQLRTVHTRFDF